MPIEPFKRIVDGLNPLGPLETHPDIQFLRNVTGAFVAPGLSNPRESIAYFMFLHDGFAHAVALGLKI